MTADPRAGGGQPRFRVLTISSNKGGVGKTTFACNLAIYLRALREDLPVLLLSFDDERMPDRMFAIGDEQPSEDIVTGFRQGSFAGAIRLGQYGVHYVPSSKQVAELKSEITSQSALWQVLRRTDWDGLVIIDAESDFEILTQNAIAASDVLAVIVSDYPAILESRRVFELFDEWGRPHQRARILLSLVDLRIKFWERESTDILAVLVGEARRRGYPLFETFVSHSPVVAALDTNPDQRALALLHRAPTSLIHKQMHLLANDVLQTVDEVAPWTEAMDPEITERPMVVSPEPGLCARDPSTEGLGTERAFESEGGERVRIPLPQPRREPPLRWARVVGDRRVRQRRFLRRAALVASILVPLALLAARWQIDTPAEPSVAAAKSGAWDFEQWRQRAIDALLETLD